MCPRRIILPHGDRQQLTMMPCVPPYWPRDTPGVSTLALGPRSSTLDSPVWERPPSQTDLIQSNAIFLLANVFNQKIWTPVLIPKILLISWYLTHSGVSSLTVSAASSNHSTGSRWWWIQYFSPWAWAAPSDCGVSNRNGLLSPQTEGPRVGVFLETLTRNSVVALLGNEMFGPRKGWCLHQDIPMLGR